LEYASSFSSEQCFEGIVAITENALRILALEKLGAVFNEVHYGLKYTPRRFVCHKPSGNMIIIETDHGAFTEKAKRRRREESANVSLSTQLIKSSVFLGYSEIGIRRRTRDGRRGGARFTQL
jgi:splicing factor 3B subunit 3